MIATSPPSPIAWPRKVDLFGVGVSVTRCEEAAAVIVEAARRGISGDRHLPAGARDRVGEHRCVAGKENERLRHAHAGRAAGSVGDESSARAALRDRVRGADLTAAVCRRAAAEQIPLYLYGSSPAVVAAFRDHLTSQYSGLRVVGAESPPFRDLTTEEDAEAVRRINQSGAGILLVGLGCPKQDLFAYEHRGRIRPVQVCVGAVFDFFAGNKKTAPAWMQRCGLEWFFRLCQEPRRLWRRYLVTNTIFLLMFAGAMLRRR